MLLYSRQFAPLVSKPARGIVATNSFSFSTGPSNDKPESPPTQDSPAGKIEALSRGLQSKGAMKTYFFKARQNIEKSQTKTGIWAKLQENLRTARASAGEENLSVKTLSESTSTPPRNRIYKFANKRDSTAPSSGGKSGFKPNNSGKRTRENRPRIGDGEEITPAIKAVLVDDMDVFERMANSGECINTTDLDGIGNFQNEYSYYK